MRKIIFLFLLCLQATLIQAQSMDASYEVIIPVQTQLDAYNTGDLELFLSAYSDTVKVYNYPDEFLYQGKKEMRKTYRRLFQSLPDLQCRLVGRLVMGNKVIDQENVIFTKNEKPLNAVAIYTVEKDKIIEVRFMR